MLAAPLPAAGPFSIWEQAWSNALCELELDVAHAERMLTGDNPGPPRSWANPKPPGQIPPSMAARAQAILARQLRVAEQLSRAVAAARRDLELTRRIQVPELDRSTPAFLNAEL
ncbi:MAG: hypothetical protein ACT4P1_16265 [Sporichthyaceae bacterium]